MASPVEVRFRASEGDQMRRGAIVTRAKISVNHNRDDEDSPTPGAVDVVVEMLSCFRTLPGDLSSVAFIRGDGVPLCKPKVKPPKQYER